MSNEITNREHGAILEKVIINNDLAALSGVEKVQHIKNVCESIGLNPLTKPIQLIKFQGKEVMYFSRDATDQLRKINNVSVSKLEKEFRDDIYIVTAYVRTPDGREDASTGAVTLGGMKGDALCNQLMKCESKAKRRATLSICGLGFAMDETETDTIPNAIKTSPEKEEDIQKQYESFMLAMETCQTLENLQEVFMEVKSYDWHGNKQLIDKMIQMKDEIKANIQDASKIV